MTLTRGRGVIGKPRRHPICWYCGSHTGEVNMQPDGTHLHEHCEEPAARDYLGRILYQGERVDGKVAWQDVRGDENDAGAWRA